MINVDVSKLREGIRDYNNILSNLSTNDAMIESKFNELASIWNDPNALKMFNSVNPNLRRVKYLESDIKSQIAAYSYACENYSKIGNKIKFNNYNIDYINRNLNNIIDQFEYVLEQFGWFGIEQGRSSWFPKISTLMDMRSDFCRAYYKFDDVKETIQDKMGQICKIEENMAGKVNNIKVENITADNFDLYNPLFIKNLSFILPNLFWLIFLLSLLFLL